MTLSRRFVFKTIFGGTAAVATLAVTQAKQLRAPEQKWDDVVAVSYTHLTLPTRTVV